MMNPMHYVRTRAVKSNRYLNECTIKTSYGTHTRFLSGLVVSIYKTKKGKIGVMHDYACNKVSVIKFK